LSRRVSCLLGQRFATIPTHSCIPFELSESSPCLPARLQQARGPFLLRSMYVCDICHQVQPPQTPSSRVVIETRATTYARRTDANTFTKHHVTKYRDDPGGTGCEIARELTACPACARQ
jgi:hypothetical protein